jgi:hypothetical protein
MSEHNVKDPSARVLLDGARRNNTGRRDWREWKVAAVEEMVLLQERAPRLQILGISLDGDLNMGYGIEMPVPRWPVAGRLVIGDMALFHLTYQESWRWESPPGWAPLGLLRPVDPFHPNMRPALRGAICLGQLPPGIPPREILLLGYYALCLQDHVLDETDPNGVLNPIACDFYRNHPEYLPLTRAGLLDPWTGGN